MSQGRSGSTSGASVSGVWVYDARGSRGSARFRDPSRQGRVTVEQGQQVDEEEDVDGHGELELSRYISAKAVTGGPPFSSCSYSFVFLYFLQCECITIRGPSSDMASAMPRPSPSQCLVTGVMLMLY